MNYITVKEFAERAGISKQAVYKKIKNPDFQKYVQKIGNSTMISELALVENSKPMVENQVENNQPQVENKVEFVKLNVENSKLTVENTVENNQPQVENNKPEVENSCSTCKLVETLQSENEYIKKQLDEITQISRKQLSQIESLYTQLKDKDKLIEQLSTQILSQTRLPIVVDPPKQTFWQKLKFRFLKK